MNTDDNGSVEPTPHAVAGTPPKPKWYSIREAADYLDVGEPTLYRWMREGKITYRKVGDSTRFWQEDLDAVMQVFHSDKDVESVKEVCQVCRHTEVVEGKVRGAGLVYFVPKETRFWTLKDSFVETTARMCTRCGAISWFGHTAKLSELRMAHKTAEKGDRKADDVREESVRSPTD